MSDVSFVVRSKQNKESNAYDNLQTNATDVYISCGKAISIESFQKYQFSPTLDFAYPVKILSAKIHIQNNSIFKFMSVYSTEIWILIVISILTIAFINSISFDSHHS